jgi:NAD(P)-dependent dehydrogenase (short-subunit alcohol dehydrogenase family)
MKPAMALLKNKKAVIAGGSRGIGKAIAQEYLKNGAEVFLIARNSDELAATRKELSPLGKVYILIADVSKQEDIERSAIEVKKKWGAPDILVNAAGVYGPIGPVTEVDPKAWCEAVEINLFGTFLATRSFGRLMKDKKSGVIINFVGGGEGAYPNFSSYVSAKGGIIRFTETVADELKPYGIRVNAIAPGAVNTKFLDDLLAAGPEKVGREAYEKSLKQKEDGGVSPEFAARTAVFLASDEARGLTGKIISARWDRNEILAKYSHDITATDVYTYRRVTPKDRGFDWDKEKK